MLYLSPQKDIKEFALSFSPERHKGIWSISLSREVQRHIHTKHEALRSQPSGHQEVARAQARQSQRQTEPNSNNNNSSNTTNDNCNSNTVAISAQGSSRALAFSRAARPDKQLPALMAHPDPLPALACLAAFPLCFRSAQIEMPSLAHMRHEWACAEANLFAALLKCSGAVQKALCKLKVAGSASPIVGNVSAELSCASQDPL